MVWLSQSPKGPAAARNHGARVARAPILAFTDDDCIPAPDWLRAVVDGFAASATIGAVTGPVLPLGPDRPGVAPVSSRTSRVRRTFAGKSPPWEKPATKKAETSTAGEEPPSHAEPAGDEGASKPGSTKSGSPRSGSTKSGSTRSGSAKPGASKSRSTPKATKEADDGS